LVIYVAGKQNWTTREAGGSNLLAHKLVFVGHVSVDKIENINGTRVQPGGAALYAAIAARTLSTNVALISAVGKDYDFPDALNLLDSKDVKTFNMPSTRFHIKYNKRWEARYLKAIHGAGSKITSRTISERWLGSKNIFHISPMRPAKVARMLDKLRKLSPETKVSIMTWVDYIKEGRKSRETLKNLALNADFFILNDSEAKALTQTDSLSSALRLLKAKMLIVTLGSLGAIISGEKIGMQMIPALNIPPEKIVDTTGAGDVWCGAFLATYNLTEDLTKSVSVASIVSSIKCSNWGFSSLTNLRFKEPNDVIEFVIGLKEGGLQKRIVDYVNE